MTKGTIEAISSKTGGLKINGKWYDAGTWIKKISFTKGTEVEFSTMEDGKSIKDIKVIKENNNGENRSKEIRRLALLNTATAITELAIKLGSLEGPTTAAEMAKNTPEALKERVLKLAKELEEWVVE